MLARATDDANLKRVESLDNEQNNTKRNRRHKKGDHIVVEREIKLDLYCHCYTVSLFSFSFHIEYLGSAMSKFPNTRRLKSSDVIRWGQ